MTRRATRLALRSAALATLCGLAACTSLDERTRLAIYRPTQAVPSSFAGLLPGDQRWFVTWDAAGAPAQRVQLWWLPHADPAAPTLLYLYGNFRNRYHNHPKMLALRRAGFSVLAVEYRGWGDSIRAVPTETSIHADADIGWAELLRRQPDPRKRVIFGHSMGGAVAVHLASRQAARASYAGLILEATFPHLPHHTLPSTCPPPRTHTSHRHAPPRPPPPHPPTHPTRRRTFWPDRRPRRPPLRKSLGPQVPPPRR